MAILVTGGLGYIGSHVVRMLQERGDRPVIVDSGTPGPGLGDATLIDLDLNSVGAVDAIRAAVVEHSVTAVIHLAALKQVGESVQHPARYYSENIGGLANLLLAIEGSAVDRFVFSSSAAVYGNPLSLPVGESDPVAPISPYGETKLAGEWLVRDCARALGIGVLSLRYFNVAGAGWPDLGDPQSLNLLTIAMDAIEAGEPPVIFGGDYPTTDGTAVRDYVHVIDLASAHLAALDYLAGKPSVDVLNVGTGRGVSVRTLLDSLVSVSGSTMMPLLAGRRAGDPTEVIADVSRIRGELSWTASRSFADIVETAWGAREWRRRHDKAPAR